MQLLGQLAAIVLDEGCCDRVDTDLLRCIVNLQSHAVRLRAGLWVCNGNLGELQDVLAVVGDGLELVLHENEAIRLFPVFALFDFKIDFLSHVPSHDGQVVYSLLHVVSS